MSVNLNATQVDLLINTRKSKKMTQPELNIASNVSLRTIQDLESGRRNTFSESTLIALCRTLDINFDDLLRLGDSPDAVKQENSNPVNKFNRFILLLSVLIVVSLFFSVYSFVKNGFNDRNSPQLGRSDWITNPRAEIHPVTPEWKEWDDKWAGSRSGMIFNYLHFPRTVHTGDTIEGEFACSFHYVGGTPEIFISLYCEWDPDWEIRLFHGVVGGDSTLVLPVKFCCPDIPGVFRIRTFYATAFGPVPSFYGAPPPGQVTAPNTSEYIEMRLEVLAIE
ncbi:MAG: helix-turn-helix transcriptional regulator [Calditrichaeota bacterium]|nr:helix-turn-helix transcriptional regulator [Calditrichota bacterium]